MILVGMLKCDIIIIYYTHAPHMRDKNDISLHIFWLAIE